MVRALTLTILLASQGIWVYAQTGIVLCFHADGRPRTEQAGDQCCETEKTDGTGRTGEEGSALVRDTTCECSDTAISSANPQLSPKIQEFDLLPGTQAIEFHEEAPASAPGLEPGKSTWDHGPPGAGPLAHLRTVVRRC